MCFGNAIGSAVGAGIGLLAILLGALYNARLTRRRDDRTMNDEAKAIAAAIGAEMGMYAEMLCARMMQAMAGPEGRTAGAIRSLAATEPVVWPALAPKIGLLDAEVAAKAVRAWALLSWHAQMLQASVDDMLAGEYKPSVVRTRCDYVKADLPMIADAVSALTGQRPPLDVMIP